jgi:hypothetical protein
MIKTHRIPTISPDQGNIRISLNDEVKVSCLGIFPIQGQVEYIGCTKKGFWFLLINCQGEIKFIDVNTIYKLEVL